jgi:hypothetical protein
MGTAFMGYLELFSLLFTGRVLNLEFGTKKEKEIAVLILRDYFRRS